jgi:hypothetical protein
VSERQGVCMMVGNLSERVVYGCESKLIKVKLSLFRGSLYLSTTTN